MVTKGHNTATVDSKDTMLTKKRIAEMQLLRSSLPKRRNHTAENIPCSQCALAAEQSVTNVSHVSGSVAAQAGLKPSSALINSTICTDATQQCADVWRAGPSQRGCSQARIQWPRADPCARRRRHQGMHNAYGSRMLCAGINMHKNGLLWGKIYEMTSGHTVCQTQKGPFNTNAQ